MEERTNAAVNATGNEKEQHVPFHIKVERFADFDNCAETKMCSSKDLAMQINSIMVIYDDYIGCNLVCIPVQNYSVIIPYMYFRLLPKEKYADENIITAFRPVVVKEQIDILQKLKLVNNPAAFQNGAMVEMTEDGMEGLEPLMMKGANGRVDWKSLYGVHTDNGYNNPETLISMAGFSNNELMKMVFGNKDSEDSEYHYQVNPVRPLVGEPNAVVNGQVQNWGLNILRIKGRSLDRSMESFGMVNNSYGLPLVKADRP